MDSEGGLGADSEDIFGNFRAGQVMFGGGYANPQPEKSVRTSAHPQVSSVVNECYVISRLRIPPRSKTCYNLGIPLPKTMEEFL